MQNSVLMGVMDGVGGARDDLSASAKKKILETNPKRLYKI